jgi:hypothetical protein
MIDQLFDENNPITKNFKIVSGTMFVNNNHYINYHYSDYIDDLNLK